MVTRRIPLSGHVVRHAAIGLAALAAAGAAHAVVPYDDFSNPIIDPGKWAGETVLQHGGTITEAMRAIRTGELHLELRSGTQLLGLSFQDQATALQHVVFARSARITEIQATVIPRSASWTVCPQGQNGTASSPHVRYDVGGAFFNASAAAPGSRFNDVVAGIEASTGPDTNGAIRARGFVRTCTDDTCSQTTVASVTDLGLLSMNTPGTLHVTWNRGAKRFDFANGGTTASITYKFSDALPPFDASKVLELRNDVPECSGLLNQFPTSRASAFGAVDFDDVYTN